mgnify:CR=1 FL=1
MENIVIARKKQLSLLLKKDGGVEGVNVTLEVRVEGPIDSRLGLVVNLTDLKDLMNKKLNPEFCERQGKLSTLTAADFAEASFNELNHDWPKEWKKRSVRLHSLKVEWGVDQIGVFSPDKFPQPVPKECCDLDRS